MTGFDLVVRGGKAMIGQALVAADIGVSGGRIVAIGEDLAGGAGEVDARGRLVRPGGIDSHCHLDQPTGDDSVMADDFRSGTRSAAAGGTTTVIPFACQLRGQSLRAAVADYHGRAEGKALIDYAFHLIVTDPTAAVLGQELPALIADGYTSFKIYMTYDALKLDDRQMLDVLSVARDHGAMVMVHAENADCIAWLTDRLERAGTTGPIGHALSRPSVVEREATHRAISIAELADVPILIVHVSGADAIEQIRWAQSRGLAIYAETCPQYLYLTADDLDRPGFEGAKCICSPPPRDRANQEVVWRALQQGVFQVFSSDHAPFRFDDPKGKLVAGADAPFTRVPNGVPGLETRLPLLFSGGVMTGRIGLDRFVELTAAGPARTYGLWPRKGAIAVGADADLALWDPQRRVTITNDMLHHDVDYTPYEGIEVTGWPVVTLSRGEVVARDFEVLGTAGRGRFLRCGPPDPARPRGTPAPPRF